MIPPPNVHFVALDDVDAHDGDLGVFLLMSDGSLVGVVVPIDELIRRGHTIVEASDAPAYCEGAVLQ